MKRIEHILALLIVVGAVAFNLWTYKLEPTAKVDPNDNPFQFALVYRTNEMWDFAKTHCGINPVCFVGYLVDHWVPNWAEGYNLPFYYSHAPQIAIVASYRFFHLFHIVPQIGPHESDLFGYYHVVIYLLLCLFPLGMYKALRVIKLPVLIAAFGAFAASQISTDGLYGLDPSSFLWRGYGLTSQLFAMIPFPLAVAYAHRYFTSPSVNLSQPKEIPILRRVSTIIHHESFLPAVFWMIVTISGHLGLGILGLMSAGFLAIAHPLLTFIAQRPRGETISRAIDVTTKLILLSGTVIFLLSYFILPALLNDQYHNYSFWDPVWKFNSWGWKEVMNQFLNGNLFDFGRFPLTTVLIIGGAFATFLLAKQTKKTASSGESAEFEGRGNHQSLSQISSPEHLIFNLQPFAFLFLCWFLLFFGRTTWGGIIDLIPSMKEFHQSRFIVGVHLAGFFLAPIGLYALTLMINRLLPRLLGFVKRLSSFSDDSESDESEEDSSVPFPPPVWVLPLITILLIGFSYRLLAPQTLRYADFNDVLIKRGNTNYDKQIADVDTLFADLKKFPPGRTFTGRGGSWGKKLQIAETTYFMHLSTFGVPVVLWLPETWSPNSDVEQFFIEEKQAHYNLFNINAVVAPPDITPQPFWKFVTQTPQWKLYSVKTEGYFTTGSVAAVIESKKEYYINLVRLWLQSEYPEKKVFPELTFRHQEMMNAPLPAFAMLDETTYQTRDGKIFGLFGSSPVYEADPASALTLTGTDKVDHDMVFSQKVRLTKDCQHCLVILKQSFHPNWRATVDGKPVATTIVFPFFIGIPVTQAGEHIIIVSYQPSTMKMLLFVLAGGTVFILTLLFGKEKWEASHDKEKTLNKKKN